MVEQHIIDAIQGSEKLLEELDRGAGARELALAKTKLEEAEMWLERSKREAGVPFFSDEARPVLKFDSG